MMAIEPVRVDVQARVMAIAADRPIEHRHGYEVIPRPVPTAVGTRRLRRRQRISLVLTMAYGHASAPNRSASLPRSTIAALATEQAVE